MTMQNNIDIVRRNIGRNMHEPKLQSLSRKIDNQRPIRVPVAIATDHSQRRADCAQVVSDRRLAHIAQMPNFIRLARQIDNLLRQLVVSIGQDENLHNENPKHHSPSIRETSIPKLQTRIVVLIICVWSFPGVWSLGFGA